MSTYTDALYDAIVDDDSEAVRQLIEAGKVLLNAHHLSGAIESGVDEIFGLVLQGLQESLLPPDELQELLDSALWYAVTSNRPTMVAALLDAGANPNNITEDDPQPLLAEAIERVGRDDVDASIVEWLLYYGAIPTMASFRVVARTRDAAMYQLLRRYVRLRYAPRHAVVPAEWQRSDLFPPRDA